MVGRRRGARVEGNAGTDEHGGEDVIESHGRAEERRRRDHSEDHFECSFSHIFAGGYSAGYYSYKWAEVLSADAFSAFEDAGLDDDAAIQSMGHKFRDTVLAQGGSRHPMEIFQDFRGRGPSTDALKRHTGLV